MTKDSPVPSPMQGAKRFRPPNINLTLAAERRGPPIVLEPESPVNLQLSDDDDDDDDVFHDTLQLSSDESSPELSPSIPTVRIGLSDAVQDDISKDLAELEQLRNSVKKNLRLRPIRSRSDLPKVDLGKLDGPHVPPIPKSPMLASISSSSSTSTLRDTEPQSAISPTSSIASSYFTPINETPNSARFIGPSKTTEAPTSHFTPPTTNIPSPIPPKTLYDRLLSAKRPLLIDTRPPATHLSFHIRHSINIAIPSLILKRCRKPGGGFQTLDALRQFITTEQGKEGWDELMHPGGPWDGDVVIYDDEMNPKDKDNVGVTAWALIPVLAPLLSYGTVDYLEGGISAGGHNPDLETLIVSGDESDLKFNDEATTQQGVPSQAQGGGAGGGLKKGGGLFQLDTQTAFRSKKLPEIEPSSSTASNPPTPPAARSPLPMMPSAMSSSRTNLPSPDPSSINIMDPTPSPPPSTIAFRRPPPPRRPSAPNLRKLDTKSTERLGANLPKLSLRTKPMRSATLTIPPSLSLQAPTSPSHLNLMYSNHSPPASARWTPTSPSISDPMNYLTPYFTPPHTPGTPKPFLPPSPSTPHTARPDLDPPTTDTEEGAFPVFTVSTILPNFLYLGPELTTPEHVQELQELGVKRILNIAAECDDDNGLKLKEVFERYVKIPMRDTVEEENIARGVREVCEILGTFLRMIFV
ncbi:hypothetical protein BDQ12DRAFT_685144 [Crucibulum laeve]|uniref:Rhodanese domain-containing protein n=1 Tax=Crucibulum laeve TaxID=68775 RepID=A0A5C3M0N6_9AGAR|nr:hypothetical protein BDQ12DRAFT_685144 [Crucibulum laeve]